MILRSCTIDIVKRTSDILKVCETVNDKDKKQRLKVVVLTF